MTKKRRFYSWGRQETCVCPKISRQALGPTHCPIKHVPEVTQLGAKLAIHEYLISVPNPGMGGAYLHRSYAFMTSTKQLFSLYHSSPHSTQYLYYKEIWGTRWRTWLRHLLQTGGSRVRFPMVSLECSIDISLTLGFDSASNRNEYQEYFLGGKGGRCLGLTNLPPSCADCLEMWETQPAGTLRACPGL